MAARGQDPPARLSAAEFTARFQSGARVLWTLAAGLLGDAAEAEDVCQEAFLAAYSKRDAFDPATNFHAWMGRFIRNVAANELRKRARRKTATLDPLVLDESHVPAAGAAGSTDARRELSAARRELGDDGLEDDGAFDDRLLGGLRELADVPRSCLLLRTLHELSYAEIAGLLEIPEGTAMSHVHRARLALRERLEQAERADARGVEARP
jgi:RNA polymerase sigma-70 factor (ECF subfamily)